MAGAGVCFGFAYGGIDYYVMMITLDWGNCRACRYAKVSSTDAG